MMKRKKIIIDGYNVIKANPAIFSKMTNLEQQRVHLLKILVSIPAWQGHEITVVFDGQSDSPQPSLQEKSGIRVVFSGQEQEADEVIQKLIRQKAPREKMEIISSDRKIQRTARDHQVLAFRSQEFWQKWQKQPGKNFSQENIINSEPDLSKKALREWLKIFHNRQNSSDND